MYVFTLPLRPRSIFGLLVILLVLFAALTGAAPLARAASPNIVISQVYGGGGNVGATYTHDFIELFNRGAAPVSLAGWSVQYASATGTGNFGSSSTMITELPNVTLAPGQYLLIQEAQGSGGTTPLPTPDVTDATPIAMGAAAGKVALVNTTTPLGCNGGSTPCSAAALATIVDLVGYGNANFFEGGGPAPTLGSTTAAIRAGNGCTDTDNNAADFSADAPNPRNIASPLNPCGGPTNPTGVGAANPASVVAGGSTLLTVTVTPGANPTSTGLSVTGDLTAIGGSAAQSFFDDGSNGDVTAGDNVFSFQATVAAGTTPGAKTLPASITDAQARSGSASIALEVQAPPVFIYDIQGDGAISPLVGTQQTTSGVVTVVVGNGFFMQDPTGDGNPATSDGIFVFTGSSLARTLAPGDLVSVTGMVEEFRRSDRPRDLTLTELSTPVTVVKTGTGAPLPAPVSIGDRPDTVISPDGIDAFEVLEGMLVEIVGPKVVGPTNDFGEFLVVAAGDSGNTAPSGNILVELLGPDSVDYNPERIMVDDEARLPGGSGSGTRINNPQVPVVVGDTASGNIVGALDYQFSNYRVQANHQLSAVLPGSTPASPIAGLRPAAPYEGRIATFNVENLFDCVDAPGKDDRTSCSSSALAELETQLAKLAAAFQQELLSPELVIVEETENTLVLTGDANGFVPGTTVPALLPRLGGNWNAVSFDASDGRGIEVGFIYNTDRVTLNDAFLSTAILPDTNGIFTGNAKFRAGREPLVGFFTLDDVPVIVVGNHFKSKGGPGFTGDTTVEAGDDPLYGAFQPPVRWTEELRHPQADYVRSLVDLLLAQNPGARIVVGGDLNDFAFSEPGEGQDTVARVKASPTDPLSNVVDLVPQNERYTFVFEGNSQVLDHLLLNAGMAGLLRDQGIAHFNADFPSAFGGNPSVTFRASDHDPLVAYFCTDATPPALNVSVSPTTLWPPNHKYVTVQATVEVSDNADAAATLALVSVVSNEPDNGLGDGDTPNDIVIVDDFTFNLRAERSGTGSGRIYTITYQAADACGNSTVTTATVTVPLNQGG